jgi:UDP-N-acetyl-D-mannosaminuronic acid dehydrogenase
VEADTVLCTDPYIKDPRFVSLDEVKKKADIVVLATPHSDYKNIDWKDTIVIDMWNFYGNGGLV